MKLVVRTLVLWLLLATLTWMFVSAGQDVYTMPLVFGRTRVHAGFGSWTTIGVATAMIPALCMWLTITAVPLLPKRWPGRLVFWMGTAVAWFAVAVMMQGRAETDGAERWAVLFGAGVTGLTATWCLLKVRPSPAWRVLADIAIAAVLWAAIGGAVLSRYNAKTSALAQRAEARWAEIGLPMAEFEKTLVAGRENAGSEIVRKILREQVGAHFYKVGTAAAAREPAIEQSEETRKLVQNAVAILEALRTPADDMSLPGESVAAIEPRAASLDADYRRILSAEPAIWAGDPYDGFNISVPNFLGLRQFAQLIAADAARRFAVGDEEGGARALSAGLHMSAGLRKEPTLVSLMIHIAIEGLLVTKQVRLPASEDGLRTVASDATDLRAELLKRLQIEGWANLRFADQASERQTGRGPLPRWLDRIQGRAWRRRQMTIAALSGAEHAAIQRDPATLALPDFGKSRHDAVSEKFPTIMEVNASRAAMRITATLLLREQVELLRIAHARMAAGTPVEPYQSAVIPMSRWELTIDKEKATVATRLVGAPDWILKNEVTGPGFWCLPLDGRGNWQFHQPKDATNSH